MQRKFGAQATHPNLRTTTLSLLVAAVFASVCAPLAVSADTPRNPSSRHPSVEAVCHNTSLNSAALAALRLVCLHEPSARQTIAPGEPIVIGFVGGFVKANDLSHPEVLFADFLRQHYPPTLHVQVFSNHDEQAAMDYVTRLLDRNHDGHLSDEEKRNAKIIIYGHSWGASQTATFARDLGRHGIPVLLTIQLDIIPKYGQTPTLISSNVASAINLYQAGGPLHGRPTIVATDPARTTILGNIKMSYNKAPVNCDNYRWFVRTFNKPHHEIENDALVWDRVASLIHTDLTAKDNYRNVPAGIGN